MNTPVVLLSMVLAVASACAPKADTAVPSEVTEAPLAETGDPVKAQIDHGATLYGANCSGCHGSNGEGGKAPAVVGSGALPVDPPTGSKLRTMPFHTAADVHAFISEHMPPNKGGSLTPEEYWAIVAFDLSANGVELRAPVGPENAADLKLGGG